MKTFRTIRSALAPRWLTNGQGGRVGYSLDLVRDAYERRMQLGHLARFPQNGPNGETAPADALAALGRDRRLIRGRSETDAEYAERLTRYLDDRAIAGNPFSLALKLQEYIGYDSNGTKAQVKTVDNRGNWYVLNANGTKSIHVAQGNWDWDGSVTQWARFWVIVHAPASIYGPSAYDWGDTSGPGWGEGTTTPGSTLGSTATYDDVQAMRDIIADWRPLGTKCRGIILAFDPASFVPTNAPLSPGLPDGLWGNWSKQVMGVQVPSRLTTARYIDGDGRNLPFGLPDPVAFTPTLLAGCILWLRGDLGITTSSGDVVTWADQSVAANDCVQSSPPKRPVFNAANAAMGFQPSLDCDGARIMESANNIGFTGSSYTVVVAVRFATLDNFDGLFRIATGEDTGANGVCAYATAAGRVVFGSTDASTYYLQSNTGVVTSDTSYVWTFKSDGAFGRCRRNGVDITSAEFTLNGTWVPPTNQKFRPGGGWSSPSARLNGAVAEYAVYDRELTSAECLQVEQYMGARYGISVP